MAEELDMTRIPQHIAITMDGNGRWATERNKPRSYGHQAGVDTVRRITSECVRLGVKFLTLYTFSTENWNRPSDGDSCIDGACPYIFGRRNLHEDNVRSVLSVTWLACQKKCRKS